MPWKAPPHVDFEDQPEYRWPFWEVGLKEDDLFGELHERFNTAPMFIQDPDAFHHDVAELARDASGREDFLARLQERRDRRFDELKEIQTKITSLLLCGFHREEDERHVLHVLRLNRYASLDSLLALCASFLASHENGIEPTLDVLKGVFNRHLKNKDNRLPGPVSESQTPADSASNPEDAKMPMRPPSPDSRPPLSPDSCPPPSPETSKDADELQIDCRKGGGGTADRKRERPFGAASDERPRHKRPRTEATTPVAANEDSLQRGTPATPERQAPKHGIDDGDAGRSNPNIQPRVGSSTYGQRTHEASPRPVGEYSATVSSSHGLDKEPDVRLDLVGRGGNRPLKKPSMPPRESTGGPHS